MSAANNEAASRRSELLDLYKIAVDEYRFQVNLNWSRSQYQIVLNLGILGLATGLLRLNDAKLAAAVGSGLYLGGVVCTVLSLAAGRVQQSYYHQTREHKSHLERLLQLGDLSIKTTPGMGGTARRLAKVTTLHTVMLLILLAIDSGGFAYSLRRLWIIFHFHWPNLSWLHLE